MQQILLNYIGFHAKSNILNKKIIKELQFMFREILSHDFFIYSKLSSALISVLDKFY